VIPLWLSLMGGAGALTRFVIDGHIRTKLSLKLPLGTTLINITGAFILGILTGLVLYKHVNSNLKLILGTGFCGGYTTFSTASFETVRLLEERRYVAVLGHTLGNLCLALTAAALGIWTIWFTT